tara:strand:- start:420 stop:995 length:576 start_codon:yes stop_codon:yes gene_type:complete
MSRTTQDLMQITASVLQEWGTKQTEQMQKLLLARVKRGNATDNLLARSIIFDGSKVTTNGTTAVWNLNDYWVYVDLGVKGVKNRAKTYTNKDFPSGFKFKNLGVPPQMKNAMQDYITRKGMDVETNKGEAKKDAVKRMAYGMAKAVKRKGIDGTRFYSDVFNDAGFKRLNDILEKALGQEVEIRIIADFKS